MQEAENWAQYEKLASGIEKLERFKFYERAKKAYAIIKTGNMAT